MEKEQSDKDAELNFLKMEMINIRDESKNKEGIIKSLEAEVIAWYTKLDYIMHSFLQSSKYFYSNHDDYYPFVFKSFVTYY